MNQPKIDIHKSAGILINDRKLLIEKSYNKEFFNAPGGSIESGETAIEALIRELKEEFDIGVVADDISLYKTFFSEAANDKGSFLQMDVFTVSQWQGTIKPCSEVETIEWVNSSNYQDLPIGSIFKTQVIPSLIKSKQID
jgi:8-oxo-dGTP diphosphatase